MRLCFPREFFRKQAVTQIWIQVKFFLDPVHNDL